MGNTNYKKLGKEEAKLKKEVKSIATKALKDGIISNEDYQKLTGKQSSSDSTITALLNDTDKLKEFVPKLKNRIDKRKKFLNECERKIDTIVLKDYKSSPKIQEVQASIQEHSIFDTSDFLRDLTVKINEYFSINHLFVTFLEKNEEFIEFTPRDPINRKALITLNARSPEKPYKKWLLKSTVMKNIGALGNDSQKISHYISQLDISLNKINKLYEWLESSNYIPKMAEDKLGKGLKEAEKRNKELIKRYNANPFNKYFITAYIPDQKNIHTIFNNGINNILEKLNNAAADFTYTVDIQPSIKALKKDIENAAKNLFIKGDEFINKNLAKAIEDGKPIWKPKWGI